MGELVGLPSATRGKWQCDVCGEFSDWTEGHMWFGPLEATGDRSEVEFVTCSKECRRSQKVPERFRDAPVLDG